MILINRQTLKLEWYSASSFSLWLWCLKPNNLVLNSHFPFLTRNLCIAQFLPLPVILVFSLTLSKKAYIVNFQNTDFFLKIFLPGSVSSQRIAFETELVFKSTSYMKPILTNPNSSVQIKSQLRTDVGFHRFIFCNQSVQNCGSLI